MERYLKDNITVPSPATGVSKLYTKEKVIGKGGTSVVATYRASDAERVVLKVSYCEKPDASETGTKEMLAALDASDPQKTDCSSAGFSLCPTCNYSAVQLLRRPISYEYAVPCFYAVFPFVENNLSQWLMKTSMRNPKVIRDFLMQAVTIMRCLRTRDFYYTDIKPSNFVVVESGGQPPRIEISDLGGLSQYGDRRITISPGQLPEAMKEHISWTDLDTVISLLLGEMLLQMLMKTPKAEDYNRPVADFFGCLQGQKKSRCEQDLFKAVKSHLAAGITINDSLSLDLLCVAFLLMGFKGYRISWKEIHTLASPINSL